jgi:hypothetical protein
MPRAGTFGGAIHNGGTLTLTNSTLSGNATTGGGNENSGGAIYNASVATITNSTLSGNSANGGGANNGGGIYNANTATITNSTIAGNSVSGGSTNYGGGIANNGSGDANFRNTIIANNTAANGPDVCRPAHFAGT